MQNSSSSANSNANNDTNTLPDGLGPMKGLILAAGRGTRLRPLTYTRPKPLLNVANRPILAYAIHNLREAGISEIGIVVSEENREEIGLAVEGTAGVNISLILQEQPKGLAHAIMVSQPWLGESDFCVYLGDNLFEHGVIAYRQAFTSEKPAALVALVQVPDPRQFGVAVLDTDGRIERLLEKPAEPPSNLAVAGVYCFTSAIHAIIATLEPSTRGEYELTDAISGLLATGQVVRGLEVVGWWKDTGRPSDMLDANRLLLEHIEPFDHGTVEDSLLVGRVQVETGAIIRRSKIVGPVLIGAGAVIEDAYIGPFTSIAANAHIRRVEIEFSVIDEEAVIEDVPTRLQECLIGRKASVRGVSRVPKTHKLVLSDMSDLELA
jgi:glucose-1-phosphate thymidylyltransferase